MNDLDDILAKEQVHSLFQPIVDLDSNEVVAYEALARGPAGDLHRPDHLFAAAVAAGRLADLDEVCQRAALRGAIATGIFAPLTLFINVEPEVVDPVRLENILQIAQNSPGGLQLMLEITERALAVRPADLLATVRRLRAAGWRIALDDVGADDLSLAFMPLLRPDVIKLDMALVQHRPGRKLAEIMNAVNAYAERTGSVVLAEGIEDAGHLATARALGATLGQGWWFGRPAQGPVTDRTARPLRLPPLQPVPLEMSPFECLPESTPLRHTSKALLIEVSKHLEREARRLGGSCVVVSTFQHAANFTPSTARRYRDLAEQIGFVGAIGAELHAEPVTGVRGADLQPGDPVRQEWDIAVLAPHFAAALIARDLMSAAGGERLFEFALTYDRNIVEAATRSLMSRVLPTVPDAFPCATVDTAPHRAVEVEPPRADSPAVDTWTAERDRVADLTEQNRLVALAEVPLLEARMNNTGVAILYLHLDNSTTVGDRRHEWVLTAVDRLRRRLRRGDLIARYGGDITVVLTDLDHRHAASEALQIASSLVGELSMRTARDSPDPVTVTTGISTFPADGGDAGQLVELAENRSRAGLPPRT